MFALTRNPQLQVDVLLQPDYLLSDIAFPGAQGYLLSLGGLNHGPDFLLELQYFVLEGIVLGLLQADALDL